MGNIESALKNEPSALEAATKIQEEICNFKCEGQIGKDMTDNLFKYMANALPLTFKRERINGVEKAVLDKQKWEELVEIPIYFFICEKTPQGALDHLQVMNNPSQLCGKVFDVGDATYTCK